MKLERFFEKFELFADAPNAVERMRKLLIHFAISGKLVPNNPREKPVALTLSGQSSDDAPALPLNWRSGLVGDAFTFEYGDSLPAPKRSETGEYPVYGSNGIVGTHDAYLTKEPAIIVGRKGSAGALNIADGPSWTTDVAYFVRPPKDLDLRFTYYLFSTLCLDELGKGIKPGLSRKEAYALPIALPPLAEQKRIVAKVDELMALCDRLEVQQQERDTRNKALARASLACFAEAPTLVNLDFLFHPSYTIPPADLRKSILTLAVQGKLVPQDPDDEPGEMLLEKINSERLAAIKARRISPMKLLPPVAEDELEYDLRPGWVPVRLIELVMEIQTGPFGSSLHQSDYQVGGTPVINPASLKDGKIVPIDAMAIGQDTLKRLEVFQLREGDIVMARRGEMGRCAIVTKNEDGWLCGTGSLVLRLPTNLYAPFLSLLIGAPEAREYLGGASVGTTMQNLNQGILAKMPVGVPPLAEQRRIVAKVDQLMALVDQLEAQLSEAKAKSAALLEAVIHELLNPTAEIIDLASYRAAIGCYAIRKMCDKPYFGRTAAMKMLYLAQAHVGMKLDLQPVREAAGPLDKWIYRFEDEGKRQGWFKAVENTSNGKMKVEYHPGKTLAEQAARGENLLSPEQRKEFDRMLGLLSDKKTEEVEIIATLFAAWNDFLIDGHAPGDDEIVTEVREHWHVKKERFTPALLRQWLNWLRRNNLVPQGRLPHTAHQQQLLLN